MGARTRLAVAALAVLAVAPSCGSDDDDAAAAPAPSEITRTAFGQAAPANAPGQVLYLQEVTIPPGERLAQHHHEGTQVATVRSGELTYDLVVGTVTITRRGGEEERATGPTVVRLRRGDTVVETEDVVHFGSNRSRRPVVITLAALLEAGAPMATPTS